METEDVITHVTVKEKDKSEYFLKVRNNLLKYRELKQYFPQATGLTYKVQEGTVAVSFADEFHLQLDPDVSVYEVFVPSNKDQSTSGIINDAKNRRLQDMIQSIKKSNAEKLKSNPSKYPLQKDKSAKKNADKDTNADNEQMEASNYSKRIINILWKHRETQESNYQLMTSICSKKRLELNFYTDYKFNELKKLVVDKVGETNTVKTLLKASEIKLAYGNNKVFDSFSDEKKSCDFWTFASNFKDNGGRTTLLLLTTMKGHVSTISDTEPYNHDHFEKNCGTVSSKSVTLKSIVEKKNITKNVSNDGPLKSINNLNKEKSLPQTMNSEKPRLKSICDMNTVCKKPSLKTSELLSNLPSCRSLVKEAKDAEIKNKPQFEVYKTKTSGQFKRPFVDDILDKNKRLNRKLDLHLPLIDYSDIEKGRKIGGGAQGEVFEGTLNGSPVVVKEIKKREGVYDMLTLREIKLMESIRHPNFVNIMAVCETPSLYHIVMQKFESKDLQFIIHENKSNDYRLNTVLKNKIAKGIVTAINYIHNYKPAPIVHRDIKPSNILVSPTYEVQVCDLGFSRCDDLDQELLTVKDGFIRGTVPFMAPEMLLHRQKPTPMSDVWAVGCTLIELYNMAYCWNIVMNYYIELSQLLAKQSIPDFHGVPPNLKSPIKRCFSYNVSQRLTMAELLKYYQNS